MDDLHFNHQSRERSVEVPVGYKGSSRAMDARIRCVNENLPAQTLEEEGDMEVRETLMQARPTRSTEEENLLTMAECGELKFSVMNKPCRTLQRSSWTQ